MKNKRIFILTLFLLFTPFLSKNFNFDKKTLNLSKNDVFIEKVELGLSGSGLVLNNGNGTNTFYATLIYNYDLPDLNIGWIPIDIDGDGISGNEKIINFDVGDEHTLVLVDNGDETRTIYSMGSNENGQIGNGTDTYPDKPTPIDLDGDGIKGNERIVNVYANDDTSAAVVDKNNNFNDGGEELWVWGLNNYWIFNDEEKVLIPRKLPLDSYLNSDEKIKLFENEKLNYSLVIHDNKNNKDTLYNWGSNVDGQIGDGTNSNKNIPTPIDIDGNGNFGDEEIINIEIGDLSSIALLKDVDGNKFVYTWGSNSNGQLGDGTNDNKNIPTPIDVDGDGTIGDEEIIDISSGIYHCSALLDNGNGTQILYTWGKNYYGQLGDGTNNDKNVPTPIDIDGDGTPGNEKIVDVSFGPINSSVNLKKEDNENSFYVWGANWGGSLGVGDGTIDDKNKPVLITLENLFNFLVINKNQTDIIFELSTNLNLGWSDKKNLTLYDQDNFTYETTYNSTNDNYLIQNLIPGKKYFFNYISFDNGSKYDIKNFFNVLTDYEINGIKSWNSTSTTAEINLDITSTNFGAFNEQERTIELEYNLSPANSINNLNSFKETKQIIVNKEGLINLSNLNIGTKYEITKISYNKKNDGSFKYFVDINDNNEITTLFDGLYLKDINDTFIIIQESITSNSFKFIINVSDEGNEFKEYDFIYLFFKNYKGGESPILAYKTNPSKFGSGTYEFEVRNLSSSTTYEFIGISIDRFMSIDDANQSEHFDEEKILITKVSSVKSYFYLFLILFLLLLLAFILMFFAFKSIASYKNVFKQIDKWK